MSDYSSTYPTQSPVFAFDAKAGKLDSRLSYSRSSGGTYLSNEKALNSENLLKQSQDFDTSWTASGIAAPTGSQTAPDGTSTAWLLTCSSGTNIGPRILQSYTATASTEYTAIAHLKAGTASHGYLSIRTDGTNQYAGALLNFSAGTISVTSAGMTSASGTVTELGSDWFRLTVTATSSSSLGSPSVNIGISDGTAIGSFGRAVWSPAGTETMYVWGAQLSTVGSKVYDSPTTTQISREYSPLLKTASADAPRFEFDASGNAKGLLIEAQATNYILNSELDTGYSAFRLTASSSACVGPTGALAQVFTETTEDGSHYENSNVNVLDYSKTYTASVYAKKVASGTTDSRIKFRINGMGGQAYAGFNLVTGTVTQQAGSAIDSASISSVGNGWYRISMTWTNEAADRANGIILAFNNNTSSSLASYVGDGFTSYALAGLMVEEASAPSSLIQTSGSAVTRAADSCSVATADIPGFSEGAGTVVYETGGVASATGVQLAFTLFSAFNSYITAGVNAGGSGDTGARVYVIDPAGDQAWFNAGTATVGTGYKLACRYELDNVAASFNGGAVVSDTSGKVPVNVTSFNIGDGYASNYQLNSTIKRIALYNEALSDTNLQAITS